MKHILLVFAFCALPAAALAEEKPLKERAAQAAETIQREAKEAGAATAAAARQAWKSTKAYLSQSPAEYRQGANRQLDEVAGDLERLQADSKQAHLASREYFQTRLRALREHLEYARAELIKLPGDQAEKDFEFARKHFNHTLESLEEAVAQAREEARENT